MNGKGRGPWLDRFANSAHVRWKRPPAISDLLGDTQQSLTIPNDFDLLIDRILNDIHNTLDESMESCQ